MKKRFSFFTILLHSILIIIVMGVIFGKNETVYAENELKAECSKDAVLQLAKIIYKEVGGDSAYDSNLNFYRQLNTGSIAVNNASKKSGSNWYEKILNLTDNNYSGYSNYKNRDFNSVTSGASDDLRGKMLYMAQLILSGKYNVPSNIIFQTAYLENNKEWDYVPSKAGSYDVYFGYSLYDSSISNNDIFGKELKDTSAEYYRKLAESLKLDDYTKYTVDNICKNSLGSGGVEAKKNKATFYIETGSDVIYESTTFSQGSSINMPPTPTKEGYKFTGWVLENGEKFNSTSRVSEDIKLYATWKKKQSTVNVFNAKCGGADILKVIKFIWTLLNIVLFIVPMGVIVMISLDLFKNVIAGKEDDMKKNFNISIKRIIFCLCLFLVQPICTFAIDKLANNVDVKWAECINIAIDPNTNFDDYKVDLSK